VVANVACAGELRCPMSAHCSRSEPSRDHVRRALPTGPTKPAQDRRGDIILD
jgi:hypothetical protein